MLLDDRLRVRIGRVIDVGIERLEVEDEMCDDAGGCWDDTKEGLRLCEDGWKRSVIGARGKDSRLRTGPERMAGAEVGA